MSSRLLLLEVHSTAYQSSTMLFEVLSLQLDDFMYYMDREAEAWLEEAQTLLSKSMPTSGLFLCCFWLDLRVGTELHRIAGYEWNISRAILNKHIHQPFLSSK